MPTFTKILERLPNILNIKPWVHSLSYNDIKFDLVRFFCSLVRESELKKMKSAAIQREAMLFLSVTVRMKIFICSRCITGEKWLMN